MLAQTRNDWMTTAFSWWQLAAEANAVIMLRLTRFAIAGPFAHEEARRMVTEKVEAVAELQMRLLTGGLGRSTRTASNRTISHYRRKISANRKRLSSVRR